MVVGDRGWQASRSGRPSPGGPSHCAIARTPGATPAGQAGHRASDWSRASELSDGYRPVAPCTLRGDFFQTRRGQLDSFAEPGLAGSHLERTSIPDPDPGEWLWYHETVPGM